MQLYRLNEDTNMTIQTMQVGGHSQGVDIDCEYNVAIQLSVTARSPAEAAKFALADLRDTEIGPWNFEVSVPIGNRTRFPSAQTGGARQTSMTGFRRRLS